MKNQKFVPKTTEEWQCAQCCKMIFVSGIIFLAIPAVTLLLSVIMNAPLEEFIGTVILFGGLWIGWIVTAIKLKRKKCHLPPLLRGSQTLRK